LASAVGSAGFVTAAAVSSTVPLLTSALSTAVTLVVVAASDCEGFSLADPLLLLLLMLLDVVITSPAIAAATWAANWLATPLSVFLGGSVAGVSSVAGDALALLVEDVMVALFDCCWETAVAMVVVVVVVVTTPLVDDLESSKIFLPVVGLMIAIGLRRVLCFCG